MRMLIEIILLLLAIPVGFLIAWMANDELVAGRKWFVALIIVSLVVGIWFTLTENYIVALTCGFILVVSFISYLKSFDRKWTRRRV